MVGQILKKIFGTRNERLIKQYRRTVAQINALESDTKTLSDEALKSKTSALKARYLEGETLDDLLPEAFAVVREVSRRTLGLRHYDVQLIGGMVLHHGKIAEMRTGEGKTLSSTLPAYLNALTGKGVHIITVNDYLAKRDAAWMAPIYEYLGMTVGVNIANLSQQEKQAAYTADITYGTNNEFGFDYLRDNMVFSSDEKVQRPLHYAVIDEVDSILIDEARTPLIISGMADESSDLYSKVDKIIPKLVKQEKSETLDDEPLPEDERGDYIVDEKNRQVFLTDEGHASVEGLLVNAKILSPGDSLYDVANISIMHYFNAALKAHVLFQKDIHYVVKNSEVIIVDEHTGRLMDGRRWSEGLHQAVEVKEGVPVQLENQTLASITFQNYFRLYDKLSGMTGTADTEAFELQKIYGLEVVVIPTNRPTIRDDRSDIVFLTYEEKIKAIVKDVKACCERGQPILVGTASIESSETLSSCLKKEKVKHEVLNAKNHEREAKIIESAGMPGAVTIATNMAGRGTDIVLGGSLDAQLAELPDDASEDDIQRIKAAWQQSHDDVIQAGGLYVLGTERHESRRIDNQLRGRAGRQGDPGCSQFYLSFDDNLLRIFAAEKMQNLMRRLGLKDGEEIQHPWITRAIENAQRRVEGMNFDVRKQLLEYDDVANDQRKVIYQERAHILSSEELSDTVTGFMEDTVRSLVEQFIPPGSVEESWDVSGLTHQLQQDFQLSLPISAWMEEESVDEASLQERMLQAMKAAYQEKIEALDHPSLRLDVEKSVILQLLDTHWKDHLAAMDHLRQSIHLRGYAQKNPAQEYKKESFAMFMQLLQTIGYEIVSTLCHLKLTENTEVPPMASGSAIYRHQNARHDAVPDFGSSEKIPAPGQVGGFQQPVSRDARHKVGRNSPCPCGSGDKYKHCHGKLS